MGHFKTFVTTSSFMQLSTTAIIKQLVNTVRDPKRRSTQSLWTSGCAAVLSLCWHWLHTVSLTLFIVCMAGHTRRRFTLSSYDWNAWTHVISAISCHRACACVSLISLQIPVSHYDVCQRIRRCLQTPCLCVPHWLIHCIMILSSFCVSVSLIQHRSCTGKINHHAWGLHKAS